MFSYNLSRFLILAVIIKPKMTEEKKELHKEFELERLILFSDAVFAIAITLLIIEIKFPEIPKDASASEIWLKFRPTIIQFFAFIISFIFIGSMWMKHLQMFRYLQRYNKGLLVRNLAFLFFIICFPFSASGITEHIRPGFMLPLIIYMCNITAVTITQYIVSQYVFQKKIHLTVEGNDKEKKYLLLSSRWFAIAFSISIVFYILAAIFFSGYDWAFNVPTYILVVLLFIMRGRLKKYKPASVDEQDLF